MKTFFNEKDMIDFGEKLAHMMFPGFVLTLQGDLGAGKTTFTKGIGKGLGVKRIINSPTFTIVKVYQGQMPLYHFDAYRLEGQNEELGFEEMFEGEGVCVIEWPQFIMNILPQERLDINIHINEDGSRCLTWSASGHQYEEVLKELEQC